MQYRSLVPKPRGSERTISRTANPKRTVELMARIASKNAGDMSAFAAALLSEAESGRYGKLETLWNWVRQNIQYENDPAGKETLRTPQRTVYDAKGDCDCMSILISSVLLNWGISHAFRVVDVSGNGWEHVYVVAIQGAKSICMDTVPEIKGFGMEHSYKNKFDYNMHTVELGRLTPQTASDVKQLLFYWLQYFEAEEVEASLLPAKQKEEAILKIVIANFDTEYRAYYLEQAVQQSIILQDTYIDILNAEYSQELGSIFSKIKDKLDKLGDTGIGKAFKTVRDTVVPIVDPLGISKKAGAAFNKVADATKDMGNNDGSPMASDPDDGNFPTIQDRQRTLPIDAGTLPGTESNTPPTTEEPWYKKKWVMWGGGGLVLLIIALVVWLSTRSKSLSGVKRRRRRTAAPVRRKAVRRRRTSASLKGITMKRRKPRKATTAKAKPRKKAAAPKAKARKRRKAK